MSMSMHASGSFDNTRKFLEDALKGAYYDILDEYGQRGVDALSSATPVDTGLAAGSWGYRIFRGASNSGIEWFNTDIEGGEPVAILIQYGHGTGTGGYVQGRDYINPAIQPIFDELTDKIMEELTK